MLPKREVLALSRPLRLGVSAVLLRHMEPSTIALRTAKGVKLWTRFVDQTIPTSSTFRSQEVPRLGSKIIKPPPLATIETAWAAHGEQVGRLEAQARPARASTTFDEFVELARGEEDLSQYA